MATSYAAASLPIDVTLPTETTTSLFVQAIENMRSTILGEAHKRT